MTTFDDRERAFETMFARDQEMQFKIVARRNRLLGAVGGRNDGPDRGRGRGLCQDVIRADFEEAGDEDVIRKLLGDLTSAGVDMRRRPRSARRSSTRPSRRAASSSKGAADPMPMAGRRDRDA